MPHSSRPGANATSEASLTLCLECPCGRSYEGKPKIVTRLHALHGRVCPVAQACPPAQEVERYVLHREPNGRITPNIGTRLLRNSLPIWNRLTPDEAFAHPDLSGFRGGRLVPLAS